MAKDPYALKSRWVKDPITGKRVRVLEGEDETVKFKVHPAKIDQIVDLYMQGHSIKSISEMPGMPSSTVIYHWMSGSAGFKARMREAREMRGLVFEDKAIAAAEGAEDKNDAPAARLRFDAYRWAAEVSDAQTYGKKTTIQGNPDAPIQFIVSTGFPEPNEHQRPPKLGSDGLIQKIAEKEEGNGHD